MSVFCPIDRGELCLQPSKVLFFQKNGKKEWASIGICPKCGATYTDFIQSPVYITNGIKYQYLDGISVEMERKRNRTMEERQEEQNRRQQEAQEQKARQQAEIQAQKKKQQLETERKQEMDFQGYVDNPNKRFHFAFVKRVSAIPEHCPKDGHPILALTNVTKYHTGYACAFCKTLFKVSKDDYGILSHPSSVPQNNKSRTIPEQPRVVDRVDTSESQQTMAYPIQIRNLPDYIPRPQLFRLSTSLFLTELLVTGLGSKYLTVVENPSEQDTNHGIYWLDRPLATQVTLALLKKENSLYVNNCRVRIGKNWKTERFYNYIKRFFHFCAVEEPITVYVFTGKQLDGEDIECVTAFIFFPEKSQYFPIPIYYSKVQDLYFINENTLYELIKKYGIPFLRTVPFNESDSVFSSHFNDISKLNRLGYNVSSKFDISDSERQAILSKIMDSGQMKKSEIASHLELLIRLHSNDPRFSNACDKWKQDLLFVLDYKSYEQRTVRGVFYQKST